MVVPVYNEQAGLDRSVRRLHRYLAREFPFSWRIVIADNMGEPIRHAIRLRALPNTPHTSPAIKDRAPRELPDPSQPRLTLPHSHRAKRPISRTDLPDPRRIADTRSGPERDARMR